MTVHLPESLSFLRDECDRLYGDRPVLLFALTSVLEDIEGIWSNGQGTYTSTVSKLNEVMAPAFEAAIQSRHSSASDDREKKVEHLLKLWQQLAATLIHP